MLRKRFSWPPPAHYLNLVLKYGLCMSYHPINISHPWKWGIFREFASICTYFPVCFSIGKKQVVLLKKTIAYFNIINNVKYWDSLWHIGLYWLAAGIRLLIIVKVNEYNVHLMIFYENNVHLMQYCISW